MALGDESEFRAGEQADTQGAHHDLHLKPAGDVAKFVGLLSIAMPNKSVRQVAAAFNGKVSRTAIGHWQSGYRVPPKWVLERLAQMAYERVRQLATIKTNTPAGQQGAVRLAAYWARRARERDAKNKAGK